MSAAERQRRRRERLRKEQDKAVAAGKRAMAADKARANYIPMPPGITYWRKVVVQTAEGEREVWTPETRPVATLDAVDLSDDDVMALLVKLRAVAVARGLISAP